MKALNWFQARGLGQEQKRAIRREGWHFWLIYRFNLWIKSELAEDGSETRRVVTATDFRDSEYLAKDWTDEPWEGATTPPCTTLPPATVLGVGTGGQGTWTANDRCGGDGEGGGVLPPLVDDLAVSDPASEYVFEVYTLVQGDEDDLAPHTLLTPDSGGCWVTPPGECMLAVVFYKRGDGNFGTGGVSVSGRFFSRFAVYISLANEDLSPAQHDPLLYEENQWGRLGATSPYNEPNLSTYLHTPAHTPVAGVIYRHVPYEPGDTISIRVDLGDSLRRSDTVFLKSFQFPQLCGY